jgi:endoglucanase
MRQCGLVSNRSGQWFAGALLGAWVFGGCSGSSTNAGTPAIGGSLSSGGRATATGSTGNGLGGSGSQTITGGISSLPTGGASNSGGASQGTGGKTNQGGAATGGAVATSSTGKGGSVASGGRASGGAGAGGTLNVGGGAGTGGINKGGSSATGGQAAGGTGGKSNTGGATGIGGGGATGGSAKGGASPTGGATAGGSSSTGACVASSVVSTMKIGWNLGNTLDSADASKPDTTVETAWGNPAVTPALMQAVASAGFGAVRIPVTWIGRFGASPTYTISPTFINRVEEVVKYVLDQNMVAIINIHHDGGNNVTGRWLTLVDGSGNVTTANTSAVLTQFKALWVQIADHFKNYDKRLIFEAMNEVMVDYNTPKQSYYDQINGLNQAFVDTVRASGGNNPMRCLVVPGYNTNIDYTVAGFITPKDTSAGKLILSDHYYDPYNFTGSASTHTWGTGNPGIDNWAQEDWVQSEVAKLKSTFIDKGLPMILGEYGAVNQSGYENYRRYYIEYVTKAVHDAGITPFYWDNGSMGTGSEAFGLLNRSNNTVQYPTILQAMMRAVTSSYSLAEVAKP